ncbi:hypothetical protein ACYJ2I_004074 [Enterobacter hormaechei]
MKPMLKKDFLTAVKSLLENGFKPTFATQQNDAIGLISFVDKNGDQQIERVYCQHTPSRDLIAQRFTKWFDTASNEHHASMADALTVGDKVQDGDTVRTVTAIRRVVATSANGTPKTQVCAASGLIVLDNRFEVMAGDVSPVQVETPKISSDRLPAEQLQLTFRLSCPVTQRRAVEAAHEVALEMNEEVNFVREFESLTAEQAMAYAQQWAYRNADAETKQLMFERDYDAGIAVEGIRNRAIADHAFVLTKPVEFRNRQFLWENTWSEEYRAHRLEAAHVEALQCDATFAETLPFLASRDMADVWDEHSDTMKAKILDAAHVEALQENESPSTAHTDISAPLRIISDYMLRFLRNNKEAKLYEAKDRLERKIVQFTSDGYDEQCLRQALRTATSSHTREAFIGALQVEA